MIHGLVLRWIVTGLFALSAVECVVPIITRRRPWTVVVSHGLHFLMAVAMAVMAWPWSMRSPTTGPAVFFLLAAVWFTTLGMVATRAPASRRLYGYHGLMMLATAWMYASMNNRLLLALSTGQPNTSMPGMNVAGMNAASGGPSIWVGAANWLGTVTFAIAAGFWASRYFTERQHDATRSVSLANLGQAAMATGMAILFLAMVSPI
jgi:hypothetical protein